MKIKIINNLEKKPNKKKIYLIDDYQTFNLEYDYSYNEMLKINRGDILNELNFIKNLKTYLIYILISLHKLHDYFFYYLFYQLL